MHTHVVYFKAKLKDDKYLSQITGSIQGSP